VRFDCHEYIRKHSQCPSWIVTDSPFWPHLIYVAESVQNEYSKFSPRLATLAVDAFLRLLANRMDNATRQVLLFEVAIQRSVDTGSHDFSIEDFAKICQSDGSRLVELLSEYPGLSRLLDTLTSNVHAFSSQLATALLDDWPQVLSHFGFKDFSLESIGAIHIISSDPHCGGRTVVALGDTQNNIRVAFKPRCVQLESQLTSIFYEVSQRSEQLKLWRFPRYLALNGHGWVEWLEPRDCESPQQVNDYFFRAGALLALALAFGVTDLHRDNIVAHIDSPVPVDLEAGLHHRRNPESPSRGGRILPRVMEWNSLGTGLLPMWIWKGEDLRGIDVSGLGALDEQWCSIALYQISERSTRDEGVIRDGVKLFPGANLVRIESKIQPPWEYIETICNGFREAVNILISSKEKLKAQILHLGSLKQRFLARPTAGYHYAIQASLHPVYLRDDTHRKEFLHSALSDNIRVEPWLVTAEVKSCMDCDIPRFVSAGKCLKTEEPYYGMPGELDQQEFLPGAISAFQDYATIEDNLKLLFETKLIRGSLLSLKTAHHKHGSQVSTETHVENASVPTESILRQAVKSAREFLFKFIQNEFNGSDDWYGFRAAPGGHYEFGLIGHDLYSGIAGILYALSRESSNDEDLRIHIKQLSLNMAKSLTRTFNTHGERLGGSYCGPLSALLPLATILKNYHEDNVRTALFGEAHQTLARVLLEPATERYFWGPDLLGGVAGALATCVSSYNMTGNPQWLPLMESLIKLLKRLSTTESQRVYWRQSAIADGQEHTLSGLSHGQAGIAWALAQATVPPHNERRLARELAVGAVNWEISEFSQENYNWPDYRKHATRRTLGEFAWSHGAPGILHAFGDMEKLLHSQVLSQFLIEHKWSKFIEAWIANGANPISPCLCHGSLGIYLLAKSHLADSPLSDFASKCALSSWADFESRALRQEAIDAPGLMIGRAGSLLGWKALLTNNTDIIPFLPNVFENQ